MLLRRYAGLIRNAHVHHVNLPHNTHSILYKQLKKSTILRDLLPIVLAKLDKETGIQIRHSDFVDEKFLYHHEKIFPIEVETTNYNILYGIKYLGGACGKVPRYDVYVCSTNHFINVFCREEFYQRMISHNLLKN
jgi:hypothetical protein